MYQYGHYGAALLGYAPLGFLLSITGFDELALLGAVGAAGLAMVPDVDQRLPLIAHRGPTHTVWFALAAGLVLAVLGLLIGLENGILQAIGLSVAGGYLGAVTVCSHIAADALTPAGVKPFAPRRDDWYSYDVARASNPIANGVLLVVGGAVAFGSAALGAWIHQLF